MSNATATRGKAAFIHDPFHNFKRPVIPERAADPSNRVAGNGRVDHAKIASVLAEDGGLTIRKAEKDALIAHFEYQKEFHRRFDMITDEAIRRSFKAFVGDAPRDSLEEQLKRAADQRHRMKMERLQRAAVAGRAVAGLLKRACECAAISREIALENERSRAEDFGVPFTPSRTLEELNAAVALIEEVHRNVEKNPDLADVVQISRIVGFESLPVTVDREPGQTS